MAAEGRPLYNSKNLYKFYIYGNRKGIRSSRKLAENCKVNFEVKWGFLSVDVTKTQAHNLKDSNFTKNKLDDRIKWLNEHTDEYLRILNEVDQQEEFDEIPDELTREELEVKLKEVEERLARYEGYQKLMEETGLSQSSITDADAKLMKIRMDLQQLIMLRQQWIPKYTKLENVPVRASIRNYKACCVSHLFSIKRKAKSGWGVCALLSGI